MADITIDMVMFRNIKVGIFNVKHRSRRPGLLHNFRDLILSLFLLVALTGWCYIVSLMVVNYTPQKTFLIISSVILFFVVLVRPEFGLGAIILITPIFNPYIREVGISGALANNMLFIMAIVGYFAKKLISRDKDFIHKGIEIPVYAMIIWMVAVQFKTQNIALMLKKFFGLILFMAPIIITYNIIKTRKGVIKFFDLLVVSSIFGSIYGIYTAIFTPFGGSVYRAYGAFINPNGLGNYLLIIIPIVITYVFPMRFGMKKISYLIGTIFVFLCLFSTKSRGAWLGVASALGLMSLFHKQRIFIIIVLCLCIIPVLSVPQLTNKLMSMVDFNNDSFMARYILWNEAVITIGQNPVFGEGMGTWVRSPIPYNVKKFDNAFNMFLTAGVGLGIPGMLILAWIFLAALKKGFFLYKNLRDPFWKSIILGLMASIFANLVHGMFEDPVYLIFTNWLIGITIGLIYTIEELVYKKDQPILFAKKRTYL